MNILLTNDDSISFIGLTALYEELSQMANVYIFAPAREKSGTSQALSIYDDVYVQPQNEHIYIVNGFPVDCVNIGLHSNIVNIKFDLVISGINKGVNMGDDVYYSGTVGAARHSFIHGYPSIAVSCGYLDETGDFKTISKFLIEFINDNQSMLKQPMLLNINHPVPAKNALGIKWTKLGKRLYRDTYKRTPIDHSEFYFNLGGSELFYKEEEGSDFEAYYNNYVSITPLTRDATNYQLLQKQTKGTQFI
ncbi:MAG: 5'/3'-nucleotidase SurE [Spirochaetia bacterium]|nr:5'/3'-nucleotidase SurE [Spirochaetia bacterium]